MKFCLDWLSEHLEGDFDASAVTERLNSIGLEVESIEDPKTALAGFLVAEVRQAEKHPNADKLKLCTVWDGKEERQVVCGAPNARAGIKVVYAPIGAIIPKNSMVIREAEIRKVKSFGMLCSADELGVGEDAGGIIELPEDAQAGSEAIQALGLSSAIIEIAVTADKVECAGVRGIARELAAAGLGKLKPLKVPEIKGSFKSPIGVSFDFPAGEENACPYFIGRYIKGVKNGPSPKWLQDRLKASGLRPISALVDITNYFSLGFCRPLHVFDADKLKGDIHARFAREGEELAGLDGKNYKLEPGMTVIADQSGVLGLGGVMGGAASGCSETTSNAYLEVAYFDPIRTATTGRKTGIVSDARYRFERGVDPLFLDDAAALATAMIMELCGGEASEVVAAGAPPAWDKKVLYKPEKCGTLGGLDLEEPVQSRILEALGYKIAPFQSVWHISVPSWRGDVHGPADIVEDILRINGYDKIPAVFVFPPKPVSEKPPLSRYRQTFFGASRILTERGMLECLTWSFLAEKLAAPFAEIKPELRIVNPISADLGYMRPSVLPNLMMAAEKNASHGTPNTALFEIGPVFKGVDPKDQALVAAGLRSGEATERQWADSSRAVDFFDVKADVFAVLSAFGVNTSRLKVERLAPSYYHSGRSASFAFGHNVLAYCGEIHPALLKDFGITGRSAGFEIFLENIPAGGQGTRKPLLKLPELHAVYRDFAFVLDADVPSASLIDAVQKAEPAFITGAQVFDLYTGKGIDPGKKSLAVVVKLQPGEKPFTDEIIAQISDKIISAVSKNTGGILR